MKYVWKRPYQDARHYPLIYSVFESDSGEVFRIEDVQEKSFEDVIEMLRNNYLTEDPLMSSKNVTEDAESVDEIIEYWKCILDQKISIACLKEDTNEIVGITLLSFMSEQEYDFKPKGEVWSEIRKVHRFIKDIFFNPFEFYSVENILTSGGCFINKNFQQHGIAEELIKARADVGKLFEARVSADLVSTALWQDASVKNDHEEKFSVTFKKLPKYVAEGYFPGIKEESLKVYCKKFY